MRFPEFTGEWNRYKVSDVLDFYSTNSLSWDQLEYNTDELQNLHYGLIHVGLPTAVDLNEDVLPNIKKEFLPKNYELCKNGDVAFADASEDTNEVAKAIEFVNLSNRNVVCGLHTIHGRDNHDLTTVGFKGYAFASESFHNQIRRIAQGTKIFSISSKNFAECYIGIPSKEEQAKIARLLKLIDERISTQIRIIEKLQSLMRGICEFILWKDYKKIPLSDILVERKERTTKINQYEVISSTAKGLFLQSDYFNKEIASEDNVGYKVLYKGDIVLSPQNLWLGNINYNETFEKGMVSPSYKVFSIHSTYNSFYIACLLKTHRALYKYACVSEQGASIVRRNLDMEAFMSISIPMPSLETQNHVALMLASLHQKIVIEALLCKRLELQKKFFLRNLFI